MLLKSFFLICFSVVCFFAPGQYNLSANQVDSLIKLLAKAKEDTLKQDLLFRLGVANEYSNPYKSDQYFNESLLLARKLNDKDRILGCLVTLGFLYTRTGEAAKAIDLLQEALLYVEEKKEDASMALAFIASNYEAQDDLNNAIEYARKSLLIYEKRVMDKLPVDERGYPAGPMRMGQLFEKYGQLDSAMYYGQISYQRILERPFKVYVDAWPYFYCQICNLLGNIHSRKNQPADAIRFYRLSFNKATEIASVTGIQESQLALATFNNKNNEPDSAIIYATQAYEGAKKIKGFGVMKESALLLRTVYEKQGDFAKALLYYDFAVAARDSVTGAEKVREVQNFTNREERRREKIQEDIVAGKSAYKIKIKTYSLLGIIAGVLLLAIILYRNNRQKNKANTLLQEQKDEVHKALSELKSTQAQLIQSEKMASLGELTAGIAHEIQNPLNFVNNFSEVSIELIAEMENELKTGDKDEAIAIATDIKQNLEKINHHGKRADGIVKGMLQHSRSSSGAKELTDINALADEYLRLAYHGLRAKDKTFNANLLTDFDEGIGKINIIPQDIGRVLLNLYNNAFYSAPLLPEGGTKDADGIHHPAVWVSTKKINDKVLISVKDNGPGIPQKIINKIFQPFFTTKPTGQGTGLGLSLSYDIVKAHGGELKVVTPPAGRAGKEGEGSEFIMILPFS